MISRVLRLAASLIVLVLCGGLQPSHAARIVEVSVVDQGYLLVHIKDGVVEFVDDGRGEGAYRGHHTTSANSARVLFGPPLDAARAAQAARWTLTSADDASYGPAGLQPVAVHRKSKINGMAQEEWGGDDWNYDYTHEHYLYLKLPHALKQGHTYTLQIDARLNIEATAESFTFDIFNSRSEAVHTNLVGHLPQAARTAADLYLFMGDGGPRDYTAFEGNDVYVYNVDTGAKRKAGTVAFWKSEQTETQWNLTGSDVWSADVTGLREPGTYRIVIEGVGASQDFEVRSDIYRTPFAVALQGYYYMRIGEDTSMTPVPRQPRWVPGEDPPGTEVRLTSMHPYHPDWDTFSSGDAWDNPNDWAAYALDGSQHNPNAIGGHSDALDWDRHLGHVSNIYDLLLAYLLTDGALSDDDLGIAESGNGIPDVIDEARNEVDFWLRLRDGRGYAHGLTNPNDDHVLYQAGTTAIAAWANALNSAMLARAFQVAGHNTLMRQYRDSAQIAFDYARALNDPMLDATQAVGQATVRGRDFKMMAASFLYDVTGDAAYEDIMRAESIATSDTSEVFAQGKWNQLWGSAAYIRTDRPVQYPELQEHMRASILHHAKQKEANLTKSRPSRRGHADDGATAWFQTVQDMPRTLVAHAISHDSTEKAELLDALLLEAGWGLGRNPLNMLQMTTATTALDSLRSVENCYTSGRNDGSPGLHPGHTPYLNMQDWGGSMVMGNPSKLAAKFYPAWDRWPYAEAYINTRYVYAHSEFTPRQTMRFKTALYGYLYGVFARGGES